MQHQAFYRRFAFRDGSLEAIAEALASACSGVDPVYRLQLVRSRDEPCIALLVCIDPAGKADMADLAARVDAGLAHAADHIDGAIERDTLELVTARKTGPAAHHQFVALPNMQPSAETYDAFLAKLTQGMDMVVQYDELLELYLYRRPGTRWLFIYESWVDFPSFEPIRYKSHMADQAAATVALVNGPVRIDYCDIVENWGEG
jgi:quinol monooxygenase YgiN